MPDVYRLVTVWNDGRETVIEEGYNPSEVRAANERVSRRPSHIARLELRDGSGCLETIWCSSWSDNPSGGVDFA